MNGVSRPPADLMQSAGSHKDVSSSRRVGSSTTRAFFRRRSSSSSTATPSTPPASTPLLPDHDKPLSPPTKLPFSLLRRPSLRLHLHSSLSKGASTAFSSPRQGDTLSEEQPTLSDPKPPIVNIQQATPDQQPAIPVKRHPEFVPKTYSPASIYTPQFSKPNAPPGPPSNTRETATGLTAVRTGFGESNAGERTTNPSQQDYFGTARYTQGQNMARRKIWVKKYGAPPTLVQIAEDDVVDDMKDMVLRKYANSLGKSYDAPDIAVRIVPRERSQQIAERHLNPEESVARLLDVYFPGGQTVDEALIIEMPQRRTPRPSPRVMHAAGGYFEEQRPLENGTDYFPPMPASVPAGGILDNRHAYHPATLPHSIGIVETGQLPPLPSPRERKAHTRPKYARQHTSSPSIGGTAVQPTSNPSGHPPRQQRNRVDSMTSNSAPTPPPIPTPPAPETTSTALSNKASSPPTDIVSGPRPVKPKKPHKNHNTEPHQQLQQRKDSQQPFPAGLLDGLVPPINVLIVEDNIINLKLLEANVKRLKVRWQTAMNGREAVTKWRAGGFHLVLMDIQLPIMNGLDATKEIRRLERINGIGVFAKSEEEEKGAMTPKANGAGHEEVQAEETKEDDKLDTEKFFKSPVIIVALTASSLQSDRHEALAAGCNDFLTKPVNREWFERKVMEWGCMQALIDFDGWRQWKAIAEEKEEKQKNPDPEAKAKQERKEAKRAALLAKMGQG